jgi:DNA-binding NtrC family response regulator
MKINICENTMILIVDDDIAVRTSLTLLLDNEGYEVKGAASPQEALVQIKNHRPQLIILDLNFTIDTSGEEGLLLLQKIKEEDASVPVILVTGWGSIDLAVRGMKIGASDFVNKPWNNEYVLQAIRTSIKLKEQKVKSKTRVQLDKEYNFQNIIGEAPQMLSILETVSRVASTDASVLITGESGTGKELIAEAIHENSLRRNKPFIKVNLGGISTSLFESEMFGHIRGAFTDARFDRVGRFELANKGTIFLDEIGDLDASSQVKLLRILQDRSYEVLGSSRTKIVDVRVVCATNKNLNEMVLKGSFREDLLYRINLITINLPALRERSNDIPLLANYFVNNLRELYNRPDLAISPGAMKWLQQLPLRGNIRQLKNLVERSVLVSGKNELDIEDIKTQVELSPSDNGNVALPGVGAITLEQMEIGMIKKAMDYHNNKVSKAAKSLGLTRSSLYRRLDKYLIAYDEAED